MALPRAYSFHHLYLLTASWCSFSLAAKHPPRYAFAVHQSKGRSGDWPSTSGYHHKACPPRAKCHSARFSPFPGSVPAMDRRRNGENGRRVGAHGPLEARETFRRCISYVYLPQTTARAHSHTSLDGGDDTEKIIVAAFKRYSVSNPLHPDVFPGASSPQPHYSFIHVSSTCSRPQNGGRNRGNVPQDASPTLLPRRHIFD